MLSIGKGEGNLGFGKFLVDISNVFKKMQNNLKKNTKNPSIISGGAF